MTKRRYRWKPSSTYSWGRLQVYREVNILWGLVKFGWWDTLQNYVDEDDFERKATRHNKGGKLLELEVTTN